VQALALGVEGGEVEVEGGDHPGADGVACGLAVVGLFRAPGPALDVFFVSEAPEQLDDGLVRDLDLVDLVQPLGGLARRPAVAGLLPDLLPEMLRDLGDAGHRGLLGSAWVTLGRCGEVGAPAPCQPRQIDGGGYGGGRCAGLLLRGERPLQNDQL